jgi:hypothetical protein
MKQLSFTPCLKDQTWTQGFHWGFEAFKTLVRFLLGRWEFDPETMDVNFLPVPQDAVDELAEVGAELFPDVPKDNIHWNYPKDTERKNIIP